MKSEERERDRLKTMTKKTSKSGGYKMLNGVEGYIQGRLKDMSKTKKAIRQDRKMIEGEGQERD